MRWTEVSVRLLFAAVFVMAAGRAVEFLAQPAQTGAIAIRMLQEAERALLFRDGFESGDLCAWRGDCPPSLLFASSFEGGDPCGWDVVVGGVECVRKKAPSLCDFERPETDPFYIHLSVRNRHGVDACTAGPFSRALWDDRCAPGACSDCPVPTLTFDCRSEEP